MGALRRSAPPQRRRPARVLDACTRPVPVGATSSTKPGAIRPPRLRTAVLGTDPQLCANACRAIQWLREYDLVPTLLTAIEHDTHPRAHLAADTLPVLAAALYDECAAAGAEADGRDPARSAAASPAVSKPACGASASTSGPKSSPPFSRWPSPTTSRSNRFCKIHITARSWRWCDVLLRHQSAGVIELLLGFLEDAHAPSAAISILAQRSDPKFMHAWLARASRPLSPAALQNLKRVESLPWLRVEPAATRSA